MSEEALDIVRQSAERWNAGDFGWGADRTQNILWRLENGELDGVNPRVIVILAGTNNIGTDLSGLKIVVDCANGAYSGIAPKAFERLGAEVTAIGCDPDGTNINVGCGATDLSTLQQTVTSSVRPG